MKEKLIIECHSLTIYINDIINSLMSCLLYILLTTQRYVFKMMSFVHFADDTTVCVKNDSIDGAIEIFNRELAKVALWFNSNKLTLNVNKTQMLMLSRKKSLLIKKK